MSILEKIKQRPDNQKRVFSLIGAGVLTAIIFFVWLSFSRVSVETKINNDKLSSISPIQVIKDEFSKAFSGLKENLSTTDIVSTSSLPIEVVQSTTTSSGTVDSNNNE